MIGLFFGELWWLRKNSRAPIISGLSIFRRIVLVAVAAAIAFVGNCVRAFFLVWVAATQNVTAANRWHDFAGYSIVTAVFIGSLFVARLLSRNGSRLSV